MLLSSNTVNNMSAIACRELNSQTLVWKDTDWMCIIHVWIQLQYERGNWPPFCNLANTQFTVYMVTLGNIYIWMMCAIVVIKENVILRNVWLFINAKWAILQLYHGKNKLHSMERWWYLLCTRPTRLDGSLY